VLTDEQKQQIIDLAKGNAHDISNAEIGELYGISAERVRQILAAAGEVKPRKQGTIYECKKPKCKRRFRGTKRYSGHKAKYCNAHRNVKEPQ